MLRICIATLALAGFATGQSASPSKAPVAANELVDVRGTISRVDSFRPGQGMPSLVVDVNGVPTTVLLGSMRYLMEQNFNPKAGAEVQVKGYRLPESIVASEVRLVSDGKVLKLRDENGWPLWRGRGRCPQCGARAN